MGIKPIVESIFYSGHRFGEDELLLRFQFRILNTVLLLSIVFSFLFAFLSDIDINPIGRPQEIADYLYSFFSLGVMVWLRGAKSRFNKAGYLLFAAALASFTAALHFVPQDEFRVMWFYLLVIAAYIISGVRVGMVVTFISIVIVLTSYFLVDLQFSSTALISSMLGLVLCSLFIRVYTMKMIDYEKSLSEQKEMMISQSRLAAMGEMMSMIAHQWRQPLHTTTLMISNAKIRLMMEDKAPGEYDEIMEKISETMLYLADTIDDFQTYFKPQHQREEILVSDIIDRAVQFTHSRLQIAEVEMVTQQSGSQKIVTFASEMVQVMINIINNAVDALIENRETQRRITVALSSSATEVVITIEDNGGGIPEEVIAKIFDPYFSTKSKNGTGLGLYMSKMIIEQNIGGALCAHNTGEGARFTIELPKG